jgi:iron complex outermembrane receptor protein
LTGGFDFIKTSAEPQQFYFDNPLLYAINDGIVGGFNLLNPNYISRNTTVYQKSNFYSDVAKIEPAVFLTNGIYLQDHIKWKKMSVVLGMRQEFYEAEDENAGVEKETLLSVFLPKVAVMYKLNDQNNLFALYSKGFDPFEASSSTQIFKETFKPVNSQIVEMGLKSTFFENRISSSHSIYKIKLQNVAVNANDITNPNLFVQRGEHTSYGFESEWNGHPLQNIYFNVNYAFNVSKITKSTIESEIGNFVENAPVNSSSSWLKYQFERGFLNHFGIVFGHLQASKRYLISHEIVLPGYITFQSGVRYDKFNWNLALNINNVANKAYWIGGYTMVSKWPGPPRNYSIQFAFKF